MTNYVKKPKIFNDRWRYAKEPLGSENKIILDIDGLVAMGSCFARNVTRWIAHYLPAGEKLKPPWDILYNPFSIEKEVERLWENDIWKRWVLEEVDSDGKTRYRDPWRTWHVFPEESILADENGRLDRQAKKLIKKATGFLFTLGLSEVWSFKKNPEIILNQVPIGSIRLGRKDWDHRFATVSETYNSLKRLVKLIRIKANKQSPIIFSLSPVPLKYTASGLSVREANNISKATLLLAIRKICRRADNVGYFPAYEMVQAWSEKNQSDVWQADGRHVTADLIDRISRKFMAAYHVSFKKENKSLFWVPRLNKNGEIVGKQYVSSSAN